MPNSSPKSFRIKRLKTDNNTREYLVKGNHRMSLRVAMEKLSKIEDKDSGFVIIQGVVSSTSMDSFGTEMSLSCLQDMQEQMKKGIPILPRHNSVTSGGIAEWDEVIGRTLEAKLELAKTKDVNEDICLHTLLLTSKLYSDDNLSRQLIKRLSRGEPIGQSIGGWFDSARVVENSEGEVERIIIDKVTLDHIAITRAPSNPDSTGLAHVRSQLQPAFDILKDKTFDSDNSKDAPLSQLEDIVRSVKEGADVVPFLDPTPMDTRYIKGIKETEDEIIVTYKKSPDWEGMGNRDVEDEDEEEKEEHYKGGEEDDADQIAKLEVDEDYDKEKMKEYGKDKEYSDTPDDIRIDITEEERGKMKKEVEDKMVVTYTTTERVTYEEEEVEKKEEKEVFKEEYEAADVPATRDDQLDWEEEEGDKYKDEKFDEEEKEEENLPVDKERASDGTVANVGAQKYIPDLLLAPIDEPWGWSVEEQNKILEPNPGRFKQKPSPDNDEKDWGQYAKAHLYIGEGNQLTKAVYKLPFMKIIDGKLHVVFKALVSAVGALNGARGGVDIPDVDRKKVYEIITKYYKEFDKETPGLRGHAVEAEEMEEEEEIRKESNKEYTKDFNSLELKNKLDNDTEVSHNKNCNLTTQSEDLMTDQDFNKIAELIQSSIERNMSSLNERLDNLETPAEPKAETEKIVEAEAEISNRSELELLKKQLADKEAVINRMIADPQRQGRRVAPRHLKVRGGSGTTDIFRGLVSRTRSQSGESYLANFVERFIEPLAEETDFNKMTAVQLQDLLSEGLRAAEADGMIGNATIQNWS